MQFVVIAYDYADGLPRRQACREDHLKLGDKMIAAGQLLYAFALLDDAGQMKGSVMVCEFETRQQLDEWLTIEPYVTNKVWETITIETGRVGPSFAKLQVT